MLLENLKNRYVTVWGSGREGQAVAAFLEGRNCTVNMVEDPVGIPLSGTIIKSPGISLYRHEIKMAKQYGAIFSSATNLFMEAALLLPDERPLLIGVTGTKGKSTTASLIAHLLREQGNRVALCGNIGIPAISYANELDQYDVVVVEMSSYQTADLQYGFDLSVVLNLYPEHIDWHKSHEQYYKDKLNILQVRKPEQVAILNANDAMTAFYVKNPQNAVYFDALNTVHTLSGWFYNGSEKLFPTSVVPLKGEHNLKNVCAALMAVQQASGDIRSCGEALKTFEALPHRLQELPMKNGIRFVDDSISTTPETAIAALKSFSNSRVVLIAGGFDRQQDYTELADFVTKNRVQVVTLPPTGKRLAQTIREKGGSTVEKQDMTDAVYEAFRLARPGDLVLLSPAAPSYGIYKNFEERGEIFARCVAALE